MVMEIQYVPLKTGLLVRRNQISGPVFNGTFCISVYCKMDGVKVERKADLLFKKIFV